MAVDNNKKPETPTVPPLEASPDETSEYDAAEIAYLTGQRKSPAAASDAPEAPEPGSDNEQTSEFDAETLRAISEGYLAEKKAEEDAPKPRRTFGQQVGPIQTVEFDTAAFHQAHAAAIIGDDRHSAPTVETDPLPRDDD